MQRTIHKNISVLFLVSFTGLLFGRYALGLVPPGITSLAFHISIPSAFLLTLFAIAVILTSNLKPRKSFTLALSIYAGSILFNTVRFRQVNQDSIVLLGYIAIPLAVAYIAKNRLFSLRHIAAIASRDRAFDLTATFRDLLAAGAFTKMEASTAG